MYRFRQALFTLALLFNMGTVAGIIATIGVNDPAVAAALITTAPCWTLVMLGMTIWVIPNKQNIFSKRIKNKAIRAQVQKALSYQRHLEELLEADPRERRKLANQRVVEQIKDWTKSVHALAAHIDRLQHNNLVQRDMASIPQSIKALKARLATEKDPPIREQLTRTINSRKTQLESLETLQKTRKRAELELENTLSSLGTIYSQMLTGHSAHYAADYAHLSEEVDEQVERLQDHLDALRAVRLGEEE